MESIRMEWNLFHAYYNGHDPEIRKFPSGVTGVFNLKNLYPGNAKIKIHNVTFRL